MSFTDLFIRRPVLAAVVSLLLLLLGAMGWSLLGVRETPDVQSPVVTVTTAWPGADPAIVESDVTEVIERELNGIEGVRTISSSSSEGNSQITVEFELERDLEAAANDVRSRVSRVRRRLPDDVEEPTVEKADASAQPVMFLRLAAENRSLLEITEIADTIVRDRIENVDGVSGIDLYGAQIYAMRIELDPARMAARGVTLSDVDDALRTGNVDVPAGRLEGHATQLTLHVEGGLKTPEEFGALVVRTDDTARIYLRDIAAIRLGAENERTSARANGVPAISVAITPQAKANIIEVSDEVIRRLPSVAEDLPPGVTLETVYDRADAVRRSIHDVELTLFVAFGLVVAVIFVFLRDWRSTLVPTLAIPVSIIGTFLVLWMAGFTVNVFTLFGLVLAIGLVVDDAIVVLENIVRRIEDGEPVLEATFAGTRQIAFAVVATTISLVAVFLPVIFTGGTTGKLFLEFGTTVAASVAISMVVALTLTPMLCSKILRPRVAATDHGPGWLGRLFGRSLGRVMARPVLVAPVLGIALAAVFAGFQWLPREFFPTEDRNFFIVRTQAQEGASFEWMDARMKEVEAELMPLVPERRMMMSRVAIGPGGVAAGTNTGMIMFPLQSWSERDRTQQEIVDSLRGPLGQITAFRTIPIQFPTVGRGFSPPLQFVIQHPDFETLSDELPRFVAKMREIPGLTAVNEDLRLDRPELWIHVDREKAAELGVPIREVARTLQVLTSGLEVSTFKRGVRQYKVMAGLAADHRASPEDLDAIYVRADAGALVPLGNLVHTDERAGAAARFHYLRAPSATISANLDGITLGEGIERVQAMADAELPEGFRTALAGESRDFADSTTSLSQMFLLALALVYLLLAAQFDSFAAPISILLAVPLALAGAFVSLWLLGMTLSFFGQVGLILLVGLVTKNGILIVEYARQLQHDEGLDAWTAAERAARLRFRPILMTSVATIGGALPIAMGLSGTSRASLGVAVVGGMITATAMTLYVTPVVYAALDSLGRRRQAVTAAVVAGLALLFALPAQAAPLTLREVLHIAIEDNLDAQQSATRVDAVASEVGVARSVLLPQLNGDAFVQYGNEFSVDPQTEAGASLRADMQLIDVAALSRLKAARLGLDAADATYNADLETTLAEVARRFVDLQLARETVAEAIVRQEESARLEALASDRVELGAAPRIDLTRASLERTTEDARLLVARTQEATAELRLAEALGAPIDTELDIVAAQAFFPVESLPDDAALETALVATRDQHPEVVAARARLAAASADRRANTYDNLPTISAFGEIGVQSDLGDTSRAPVGAVGASATVPLWAGGGRAAATRGAKAVEDAETLGVLIAERALEAELRVALRRARDAGAGLDVAEATVELAREELDRATVRYREGAGDNLSVVTAQGQVAEAQQFRVNALGAYNRSVIDWFSARGRIAELAR